MNYLFVSGGSFKLWNTILIANIWFSFSLLFLHNICIPTFEPALSFLFVFSVCLMLARVGSGRERNSQIIISLNGR